MKIYLNVIQILEIDSLLDNPITSPETSPYSTKISKSIKKKFNKKIVRYTRNGLLLRDNEFNFTNKELDLLLELAVDGYMSNKNFNFVSEMETAKELKALIKELKEKTYRKNKLILDIYQYGL
ncbi:MAG: hypothetical protein K9K32_00015 [Halanaerobiales bacterium]|nr:hypothetical protein [Halanaerobiales bacterium]